MTPAQSLCARYAVDCPVTAPDTAPLSNHATGWALVLWCVVVVWLVSRIRVLWDEIQQDEAGSRRDVWQ